MISYSRFNPCFSIVFHLNSLEDANSLEDLFLWMPKKSSLTICSVESSSVKNRKLEDSPPFEPIGLTSNIPELSLGPCNIPKCVDDMDESIFYDLSSECDEESEASSQSKADDINGFVLVHVEH